MGESDYSPPTVSSTIMEQTDLERFRATLNLDAIENKIASQNHSIDQVYDHLLSRITSHHHSIDQIKNDLSKQTQRMTSQIDSINTVKHDIKALRDTAVTVV